ncbi:MAG TPA: glycosyltransferase family 4 protein [Thermomicrobiales bacterium]
MRVLMVTDFYPPAIGGVERHVQGLSRALVRRGHHVGVATLEFAGAGPGDDDQGVRIHRIRGSSQRLPRLFGNPHRPWAPPLPDPELVLGLRRIIDQERPDVVHGHDWLARSFLPLKRWSGAAFVLSLHYYTLSCAKKSLVRSGAPCDGPGVAKCVRCAADHYGRAKGPIVAVGNHIAGVAERKTADRIIAVSQATATGNGLTTDAGPHLVVVPNFVPEPLDAAPVDLDPYLRQLPADGFLLFVGDLRRDKGIEVLLRAYAGLKDAPPLVLIGKLWPESPTVFPDGVRVLADWPNEAVMAAWRRSLFGIVPSIWPEPFGIVLIEAMASGRPVVASRIGGIPDVVDDEQTGLLVPPADPRALRDAIARLLSDCELRRRMGQEATRRVDRFREATVVPRIEQIYQDAIASRHPSSCCPEQSAGDANAFHRRIRSRRTAPRIDSCPYSPRPTDPATTAARTR